MLLLRQQPQALLVALALLVGQSNQVSSFTIPSTASAKTRSSSSYYQQKEDATDGDASGTTEKAGMNPLTKASWFAVEAFGNVFGNDKSAGATASSSSFDFTKPPSSLQETLDRIRLDNDRDYFLSGQVDTNIYDPDCVFADPFVSFSGRDRFVTNLANLGSFITNYSVRDISYDDASSSNNSVQTKVMVKLELNLPWKPILAWPWGVRYDIDPETFLITNHIESWDIAPAEGVKQIFRKPTTSIR